MAWGLPGAPTQAWKPRLSEPAAPHPWLTLTQDGKANWCSSSEVLSFVIIFCIFGALLVLHDMFGGAKGEDGLSSSLSTIPSNMKRIFWIRQESLPWPPRQCQPRTILLSCLFFSVRQIKFCEWLKFMNQKFWNTWQMFPCHIVFSHKSFFIFQMVLC